LGHPRYPRAGRRVLRGMQRRKGLRERPGMQWRNTPTGHKRRKTGLRVGTLRGAGRDGFCTDWGSPHYSLKRGFLSAQHPLHPVGAIAIGNLDPSQSKTFAPIASPRIPRHHKHLGWEYCLAT